MRKGSEDVAGKSIARKLVEQTAKVGSGEINSKGNCVVTREVRADGDCSDNSSSSSKITRVNSIEKEAAQSLSMMNANGNKRISKEHSRDSDLNVTESPTSPQNVVGGKNDGGKRYLYSARPYTKGLTLVL